MSDIRWASRWDTYLEMGDVQIHWFSIINSIVVVFFLAGILAMIIGELKTGTLYKIRIVFCHTVGLEFCINQFKF